MGILLLMAILVIYIVLGILYESFIHPLTILSGLPSAGIGALVALLLFRVDLSLYAVVGGLLFSQVITLYITPVIYTFLDEFQASLRASAGG